MRPVTVHWGLPWEEHRLCPGLAVTEYEVMSASSFGVPQTMPAVTSPGKAPTAVGRSGTAAGCPQADTPTATTISAATATRVMGERRRGGLDGDGCISVSPSAAWCRVRRGVGL